MATASEPNSPKPTSQPPEEILVDRSDRYTLIFWLVCFGVMWLLGVIQVLRWFWAS